MAVAQAQHDVRALADLLEARGVEVTYAIHPVAGRMPGHMNVLLAEANVPYPQLKEMDEANNEFARTDVSLVIGANDVVNPDARNNQGSPIYGMPILNVDESQRDDRAQAVDEPRLRRHRQPALPRPEDDDAVRRREGIGRQAHRRRQGAVTPIPVLTGRDVGQAVSPASAVEAVREAFIAHARGEWPMPPKVYVTNYPAGDFRAMPAIGGGHALLKWVTSFPGNPARGLPTVSGLVLVSDAEMAGCWRCSMRRGDRAPHRRGGRARRRDPRTRRRETAAVVGAGVNGRAAAATFLARGRRSRCGTSMPSAPRSGRRARRRRRAVARGRARRRSAGHRDAGPRGAARAREHCSPASTSR